METFSERLNEAIQLRGVSQKWLANEAETTEATISRYLSGKSSPALLQLLGSIAKALDVSSDFLIGRTNLHQSKDTISDEKKVIIDVWDKVSDDDRKVFYALLDKYLSPKDKDTLGIKR